MKNSEIITLAKRLRPGIDSAGRKHVFVGTRSKTLALKLAEAAGVSRPIAVSASGGFVVYSADVTARARNPKSKTEMKDWPAPRMRARLAALEKRSAAALDAVIAAGYGSLKPSEMRRMQNKPDEIAEYLAAMELESIVRDELAEREAYHGSARPIRRHNPKKKKAGAKMRLLHGAAAPAKRKRARRKNPTVKGAYWIYLRTGRGWLKLGERPSLPLAKRMAQQVSDRTQMQTKIALGRGRAA